MTVRTALPLKRTYGSWLMRLLRGGTRLADGEWRLLCMMVAQLPLHLRKATESQFGEYNLVQREIDGRALNFYRLGGLAGRPIAPSRLLAMVAVEAPLIRVAAIVPGESDLNATLNAVSGRVFCVDFDRPVPNGLPDPIELGQIVQAWRSNFPVPH